MRFIIWGICCLVFISCQKRTALPVDELTNVRVARKVYQKEKPLQPVASVRKPVEKIPADTVVQQPVAQASPLVELSKEQPAQPQAVPEKKQDEAKPAPVSVSRPSAAMAEAQSGRYHVITGSLSKNDMKNMKRMQSKIESYGYTPLMIDAGDRTRISIGGFETQQEAQNALKDYVRQSGIKDCWVLYVR